MKKALLMTWYNSNNYGTLLQAYATKEIFKERYDVECFFINYIPKGKRDVWSVVKKSVSYTVWKKQINNQYNKYMFKKRKLNTFIEKRSKWVSRFIASYNYANEGKPVKSLLDFKNLGNQFELFISGGDQIWNPRYLNEHFLLDFVPENKCCISFASSLSAEFIPDDKTSIYRKHLAKYNGITLREHSCAEQMEELLGKKVDVILDPTLLYGADKWLNLMIENNKKNYLLLYLLGNSVKSRHVAKEIAKNSNLSLYTFPFLSMQYFKEDELFSDEEQLWEISPFEWIAYIKNAEIIITDSFHMTVFSIMLHKNFYVVEKNDKEPEQNNRIINLLSMVGLEKRFCKSIDYNDIVRRNDNIDWETVDMILKKQREKSFAIVDEMIEKINK